MDPSDLCICLLSGGGSALLPAPISGISLADKQQVTQFLSAAGANIQQLNTVRKQLSAIKGGRLAKACRASRLVTLIISDVPGDPLDIIASGPTVVDSSTPADAIAILDRFEANESHLLNTVYDALRTQVETPRMELSGDGPDVNNHIIGNNQLAVEAAVQEARSLGYRCDYEFAVDLEGPAEEVGQQLSRRGQQMKVSGEINCWISGGEPTVQLAPLARRGRGGRNQQLVLAALDDQLQHLVEHDSSTPWQGIALLSGGTDGDDGPTDAAGAFLDQRVAELARQQGLHPQSYLDRNDAYSFFNAVQALIKTGPTHTNVCDLRILLTDSP
jgi:glycerate-2-kinase